MLHTTFALAKKAGACQGIHGSYQKMATALGGITTYGEDTPIPLTKVLEVCGLNDTLWTLECTIEPSDTFSRLLSCDYAERVLPNYEDKYPNDDRVRTCIDVSRKFAYGKATNEELLAAWEATDEAAKSAWLAAWPAESSAARAAESARRSARSAVTSVARSAAWAATWPAEEVGWQTKHLREMLLKEDKLSDTLYELTAQYQTLLRVMESEEDPGAFALALTQIQDAIENKVENIGKLILDLAGGETAVDTEIKRLTDKKRTIQNRQSNLKNYLLTEMVAAGITQVKKSLFTVSVKPSPPSVQIVDEGLLPAGWWRIVPEQREPDKVAILNIYKATGEIVPGTAIISDKKYLQIK